MQTGASASNNDNAGPTYKRKRSSKACTVCRQKKVRCSGTEPCRHCIEFGESCIFDDSIIPSTRTLSDVQLRLKRAEHCIRELSGQELPPLGDFDEEAAYGPVSPKQSSVKPASQIASGSGTTKSRKRQRQQQQDGTEDNDADMSYMGNSNGGDSYEQNSFQAPNAAKYSGSALQEIDTSRLALSRRDSHTIQDEEQYLSTLSQKVEPKKIQEQPIYHPFTKKIRATARQLAPEEMYSTDEEEAGAIAEAKRLAQEERIAQMSADLASAPRSHGHNDNQSSPVHQTQRSFSTSGIAVSGRSASTIGPSTTTTSQQQQQGPVSSSIQRTGSSSSAPAALGPTTAKISSSVASELRVDKKGNLRYIGAASTSAVVAELSDRQRWDVQYPILTSAAAARRRSSTRFPLASQSAKGAAAATTGGSGHVNLSAQSSATSLGESGRSTTPGSVADSTTNAGNNNDEMDEDGNMIETAATTPTQSQQQPQRQEFLHPPSKPKPWEIFSNLGVTVEGALPPVEAVAMPPEDLARKLVDGFFEFLHPIFPIVHRAAFVKDMNHVYALKARGEMRKADAPFLTVFFALLACASLVVDDPRVYEEGGYSDDAKTFPAEQGPLDAFAAIYTRKNSGNDGGNDTTGVSGDQPRTTTYNFGLSDSARRQGVRRPGHRYYAQVNILILHSLFQPSVDQAVLYGLMAYFHVSSNAAARGWVLSRQALGLAIELGLHRSSVAFKPYARERRRRVFWALFALESLLANNLGRPPSIPIYEIDQERPENVNLDDLMPGALVGPPRKGEIAGFLHLVKLHYLTAEALRTISRHQRAVKPISATELQKRLLKYETDLQEWYKSCPKEVCELPHLLPEDLRTQRYISEEATEFQTYALTRCVYACKDHVTFARSFQRPIPPSHYLFNLTQHLLVSGALLLLICHRGLQNPELLDRQMNDVEACVTVLTFIGQRFVGGQVGAEMLRNMQDNMKHSETWKTRLTKIAEMGTQPLEQIQGPPFPPMPLPGPRRMAGILQPSTIDEEGPSTGATRMSPPKAATASRAATTSPAVARTTHATSQPGPNTEENLGQPQQAHLTGLAILGSNSLQLGNAFGAGLGQAAVMPGSLPPSYIQRQEPGYPYPVQQISNNQQFPPQTPEMPLWPNNYTPVTSTQAFLEQYPSLQGNMQSEAYNGNVGYETPQQMWQTWGASAPVDQTYWPSDNLNFNIEGLEEITARSHNSSFLSYDNFADPNNPDQYSLL